MNILRSSLATAAACGLLFSAAAPAFAAPKDYQITGDVVAINDTTISIKKGAAAPWEIGKGADTKGADALKVGDHVTVHYTMLAGTVEVGAAGGAKEKKGAAAKNKAAAAETTPAASGSPSKPAAEAASPTP